MMKIPFNKSYIPINALEEINNLFKSGNQLSGDGIISQLCEEELGIILETKNKLLLTNSCTSALEISAITSNLKSNDEVIIPSYTFVATATPFIRAKAKIKFCDIDIKTGNICLKSLEKIITNNTKVIIPVHYAGSSCDLDQLIHICKQNQITIIEDCAQAIHGTYKGEKLGKFGDLGCFSFHDTKNISAGEGGCLTINKKELYERTQYIRDKGTNRKNFIDKLVNKYHWVDQGSSFLMSEINACFLLHGLKESKDIHKKRKEVWNTYFELLKPLEDKEKLTIQKIPRHNTNAAHLFFILVEKELRSNLINYLRGKGIEATFHYIPLHISPYGSNFYNPKESKLKNSSEFAEKIIRLPLRANLERKECEYICSIIHDFFSRN